MNYIKPAILVALTWYSVSSVAQTDSSFLPNAKNVIDTISKNNFGDLLNDDSLYNKKRPVIEPAGRIIVANVVNWAIAKYVYKFDWPSNSVSNWKNNFQKGPEWDDDVSE